MNTSAGTRTLYDEATLTAYLRAYLREAAVATSIWRSIEAAALASVELHAPLLDIGCGFGEFVRLFFRDGRQPDIGIDIDAGELRRAIKHPTYKTIAQADARRMPFRDGSFSSIMSISTMEHIPNVDETIAEAARVLKPGGTFAYTVPIEAMTRNFTGHRVLRIASTGAAEKYAGALHRQLTHVNIWPASKWVELTEAPGLTIERATPIVSPAATRAFEALLPAAFANRMWRVVTGSRPPHPDVFVNTAVRMLRTIALQQGEDGSNLLVVARKPLPA